MAGWVCCLFFVPHTKENSTTQQHSPSAPHLHRDAVGQDLGELARDVRLDGRHVARREEQAQALLEHLGDGRARVAPWFLPCCCVVLMRCVWGRGVLGCARVCAHHHSRRHSNQSNNNNHKQHKTRHNTLPHGLDALGVKRGLGLAGARVRKADIALLRLQQARLVDLFEAQRDGARVRRRDGRRDLLPVDFFGGGRGRVFPCRVRREEARARRPTHTQK